MMIYPRCPQLKPALLKLKLNYLIFGFVLLSCKQNSNTHLEREFELRSDTVQLKSLDYVQEILLIQTDDRLGEWGGNTFIIKIYKEGGTDSVLADYKELEGTMEPPPPPSPIPSSDIIDNWFGYKSILTEINKIRLNENDKKIIEAAIIELAESRIKNDIPFSHSGISNTVIFKDSSLIVEDYPSIKWSNFLKLKKSLLEK